MWGRINNSNMCFYSNGRILLVFFNPDVTGGENFITVDVLSEFHSSLMLTSNV